MKFYVRTAVAGILLAILTIRGFVLFASPIPVQLFTLFLAYTACVYLGAALSDSRVRWISIEFLLSTVFYVFAVLGLIYSPVWVAIGFILHGVWDMLHHPRLIKTKVVRWFPPLCAVFDWIVGIYILVFY